MFSIDIITIVLSLFALVHLLFSVLMLSALRVTKNIPFASKFLSTGLILFDVGLIISSAVNRFEKPSIVTSHISTMSALFQQLAYATMTLMAVERMLVLKWPMKYIQFATERKIKCVTFIVWICVALLILLMRYLLCWATASSILAVFTDGEMCAGIVMSYHLLFITFGQTISTVSYIVVMKIVRRQMLKDYMRGSKSLKSVLRIYKSTGMVFIYIIVMTITSLLFYIAIALKTATLISGEMTRTAFQFANVFNCALDPFLYVLWYTECRLACKKLLTDLFCRFFDKDANSATMMNTNRVFQIECTDTSGRLTH